MINAIIESLTDEDDLTKPLLKTLVFAKRLENTELAFPVGLRKLK